MSASVWCCNFIIIILSGWRRGADALWQRARLHSAFMGTLPLEKGRSQVSRCLPGGRVQKEMEERLSRRSVFQCTMDRHTFSESDDMAKKSDVRSGRYPRCVVDRSAQDALFNVAIPHVLFNVTLENYTSNGRRFCTVDLWVSVTLSKHY